MAGPVGVCWFFLGPWYAQTVMHQDLHDPVNMAAWVCIGLGIFVSSAAQQVADAIKEKK
jgi:hypothetical protein